MSKYIYDPKLVGKHSKFDKKMFEKYDTPAREKIKNRLLDFVKDNPDIYQQDLIITEENFKYKFIEIQVCATWVGDKFPFKNVYLYERKGKYNEDTLFITLNKNLTKGYLFDATSIKDVTPRRFRKYGREFVFDVPWHRILSFDISVLDKELIEMY